MVFSVDSRQLISGGGKSMLSPSLYINGMALGRTGRSLLPEEEDERMESEVPHHMPVWMCDSFDLSAKDSCSLLSVEDSDIQTVTSSVCSFEEVACSLSCLPVKSSCCLLFFRIFCIFISVLSDFFQIKNIAVWIISPANHDNVVFNPFY